MTWLARIRIPVREAYRLRLTDNDRWHKFSWQCFPEASGTSRDFLTRLDAEQDCLRLYVLAARKPVRPACCAETWWGCREISAGFLEHEAYRFSLRANPTRKVRAFDAEGNRKRQSRKTVVPGRERQKLWLERKGDQAGFVLDERVPLSVSGTTNHTFYRNGDTVLQVGVEFRGVLRVTDGELFKQAFLRGLGSARAFGFGMLLLRPLSV